LNGGPKDFDRQRIDKWLWHARMVRTRNDAAALTMAGFVRINGRRMTASGHPVRVGDVVTLALDRSVRVLRVEGICARRGGAPAARALYRDLTTSSGTGACTGPAQASKVSRPGRP
jgi:ribosome-associated heat shock protein Hsp15